MQLSVLFWVIYVLSLLFGLWSHWPVSVGNARPLAVTLIIFVLVGILGWEVFGAAVKK